MVNKDNSERIERFLREQMTPEENEAFLNDLKDDRELREEAQMMALLIKEMKEEQTMQDEAITQEILASERPAAAKTIQLVKWIGSIAAMFILLFGANQWYSSYKIDKVYDAYYTPYDASLVRGGDDEAIKKELAELYNKVETEKDITPIISRLQSIYDGIQANSDEYSDYSYYENDIAWYLALAYIKEHNLDMAKELLKQLVENGNTDAIKLLEDLKNL